MPSARERILRAIVDEPPMRFVSAYLLDRVPHVFGRRQKAYADWRHDLAAQLSVDPAEIALVGSAATGVSLNPTKNFRAFQADSDIDVAVISNYHFDVAWRWLRTLGAERYRLPQEVQQAVLAHVNHYVYWGAIATDRILPYLPFGRSWILSLTTHGAEPPFNGREFNVRLYRDWLALRDYHVRNARKLQQARLAEV